MVEEVLDVGEDKVTGVRVKSLKTGASSVVNDRETVRLADVQRVDGLEAQPVDVGDDRDLAVPREDAREKRAEEVAPLFLAGAALEDQAGPEPDDARLRPFHLEVVEQTLDLGLVTRIETRRRTLGRPALVHRPVLRARRIGAHR